MRYDILNSDIGSILFSRDDKGINRIHFLESDKPFDKDESWQQSKRDPMLQEACRQLKAYFRGTLREFSLPLSFEGTDFQLRVWKMLITIPYGTTWSYKELAMAIGNPAACRAVGNANNKNKLALMVP